MFKQSNLIARVGAFYGHCETSRKFVDNSTGELDGDAGGLGHAGGGPRQLVGEGERLRPGPHPALEVELPHRGDVALVVLHRVESQVTATIEPPRHLDADGADIADKRQAQDAGIYRAEHFATTAVSDIDIENKFKHNSIINKTLEFNKRLGNPSLWLWVGPMSGCMDPKIHNGILFCWEIQKDRSVLNVVDVHWFGRLFRFI